MEVLLDTFFKKLKNILRKIKNIFFHLYFIFRDKNYKKETYFISEVDNGVKYSNFAIIIHLFYIENWGYFKTKLDQISDVEIFDLYITMPQGKSDFISEIQKSYPNVKLYIVPNHGRDVLPFLKIGLILEDRGYEYLLKFHSKKSLHRQDGQDWLVETLNQIIGTSANIEHILSTLKQPTCGIIGPKSFYYPFSININANGILTKYILEKQLRKKVDVAEKANDYGFFGGTMFWSRVDAIQPLFHFSKENFPKENGQIDGTFAHALERAFCLLPELNEKKIYSSSFDELVEQPYASQNIPEWFKEG